jgi:hypothetical protein
MEHIDAILYINLAHRTDRNEHILAEIATFCSDASKIHRIDAVLHKQGAIGCGQSHVKVLRYAQSHPEWKYVLILEDDFTCKPGVDMNHMIQLLYNTAEFDVGLLSHNELICNPTSHDHIKKVIQSMTTSSYIIKQEYISLLLQNMLESVESMERDGIKHLNCIDTYWNTLQFTGNWYCIYPAIGYQYCSYSDIQMKVTDYGC